MGDKPVDPVFMLISKEAKPGQTSKVKRRDTGESIKGAAWRRSS